jgi:hypothetical protein
MIILEGEFPLNPLFISQLDFNWATSTMVIKKKWNMDLQGYHGCL